MNAFFPELETGPCFKCPLEPGGCKIPPQHPQKAVIAVVGSAPDAADEFNRVPFSGPAGDLLRSALLAAGIDPSLAAFVFLTRCRPGGDDFDGPAWDRAARRCQAYLDADLAAVPGVPLLLLGSKPLRAFSAERKPTVGAMRGLWVRGVGRECFVARDPRDVLAAQDLSTRNALVAEFKDDVRRMAPKILGREPDSGVKMQVFFYDSPEAARGTLESLAATPGPWAFDIETYDAAEFPSRRAVATDPCHPDFRLRGIAFAWGADRGAWVDCKGWEPRVAEARELLAPVFGSPAEKWAFSGHFDEEGIVYPGWAPEVRNRTGDGMLALVALSDGTHDSLRLEKAVVDVLRKPQYWDGFDKGRMRDIPIQFVARNAVGDACHTFALCEMLHGRLDRGDYMTWRK